MRSLRRIFGWPIGEHGMAAMVAVAVVLASSACTASYPPDSQTSVALTPTGGRPYASDSPWNVPIPQHPKLDENSAAISAHLASKPVANLYEFGTPVYTVGADTPRVPVRCTKHWGVCQIEKQLVPIPAGARPSPGSDGSMTVVDSATRTVFDFWQVQQGDDGTWQTSWGTVSALDEDGRDSVGATGAGFSTLAGLVRTFEIENGHIDHALVFSSDNACRGTFRYPATKTDGQSDAENCIPEGARVQLDPSINVDTIPGITHGERTVAKALQTYGAYCRDRGGAPMAINFEYPTGITNPYPAAGFRGDYYAMPQIPWNRLRVLHSWDGQ